MQQTYRIRSAAKPAGDIDTAFLAIFNGAGSGKVLTVKQVTSVGETAHAENGTGLGLESLVLVTGHERGSLLSVSEFDSTNSLPSQVTVRSGSVVSGTGAGMRRSLSMSGVTTLSTSLYPIRTGGRMASPSLNMGSVFCACESLVVQPIVLREGEGVAWIPDSNTTPQSQWFHVTLRFSTTEAGNPTYQSSTVYSPRSGVAGISVVNGSGSGVVLKVLSIEVAITGQAAQYLGFVSLTPIEGIDKFLLGTAVGAVPMDSENDSVPSQVKLVSGCGVQHVGTSLGIPESLYTADTGVGSGSPTWTIYTQGIGKTWHRHCRWPKFMGYIPPRTGIQALTAPSMMKAMRNQVVFSGDLVLREGSGLAIMPGTSEVGFSNSGQVVFASPVTHTETFEVEFTMRDATPADLGVPSYAFAG